MPSPFPGMDPYLENPDLWPDVHLNLLVGIGEQLTRSLRPRYVARIRLTTFMIEPDDPATGLYVPDEGVFRPRAHEPFSARHRQLEVRRPADGRVVTVIEITCPWGKLGGTRGREVLQEKRLAAIGSGVNWLEVDLLRMGDRAGELRDCKLPSSAYRILLTRDTADGPRQDVWPVRLQDRLPALPVPAGEVEVVLDLQVVLGAAYERAAYDADANYGSEPVPPLDPDDAAWTNELLRAKGLRK